MRAAYSGGSFYFRNLELNIIIHYSKSRLQSQATGGDCNRLFTHPQGEISNFAENEKLCAKTEKYAHKLVENRPKSRKRTRFCLVFKGDI